MFEDIKLVYEIIFKPFRFFDRISEQPILELYKFWVLISLISSITVFPLNIVLDSQTKQILNVLTEIIPGLQISNIFMLSLFLSFSTFIMLITFGFVGVVVYSEFVHLFAYLFKCRGSGKTFTALIISLTPGIIFGFFPTINVIFGIYSFILFIIGLSKLHKISILKSSVIFLLSLIVPSILLVLIDVLLLFLVFR